MAAPTPPATRIDPSAAPTAIAAAPRKLPVKRKDAPNPPSDDDDDDDFDETEEFIAARPAAPPFRFQRVWSETDEIRFLQGLLGCWSQGLVFPRDLNLFFDRFSESIPQPYTRSQLSEKLRRLRKKFRVMSARIARGQDPSRLSPHDRDVLHLCTRLWHTSYAASSPFSFPDALAPGSGGNKRRRSNPRAPSDQTRAEAFPAAAPPPLPISALPPPLPEFPPPTNEKVAFSTDGVSVSPALPSVKEQKEKRDEKLTKEEKGAEPPLVSGSNEEASASKGTPNLLIAKTVLDVFDACLEELKLPIAGSIPPSTTKESDLEKRWRELRAAEMNAWVRRFRLVLENFINN